MVVVGEGVHIHDLGQGIARSVFGVGGDGPRIITVEDRFLEGRADVTTIRIALLLRQRESSISIESREPRAEVIDVQRVDGAARAEIIAALRLFGSPCSHLHCTATK